MKIRAILGTLVSAALLTGAAPLFAQKSTVDDLCRLHGVGDEGAIARVKRSYGAALKAGISDEELYPFLEDILKHKLDCAQMERVLESTTRLRRESLPYFVVFSKVREGVAKDAPPALVVEAAESKVKTLIASRDVLSSLEASGYRVRDFQNAAVIVSSYIEKGYHPGELVSRIRAKGIAGSGFAALSGVIERAARRKAR